ncbi:MAG: hypothetical protein LC792_01990 [Actinobacteria bacterium]|nr:hypothetical protein [Actinomycetota bacterium]
MGITVRQFPHRDEGTNAAAQREEPETFVSPADNEATGAVAQADNLTYADTSHRGEPTGVAAQREESETFVADYPETAVADSVRHKAVQGAENKAPRPKTKGGK